MHDIIIAVLFIGLIAAPVVAASINARGTDETE
jgi:hypothetical protein